MNHEHVWKDTNLFLWFSDHSLDKEHYQQCRCCGQTKPVIPEGIVNVQICECGLLRIAPSTYNDLKDDGLIHESKKEKSVKEK